jgi:hypothetical protein
VIFLETTAGECKLLKSLGRVGKLDDNYRFISSLKSTLFWEERDPENGGDMFLRNVS